MGQNKAFSEGRCGWNHADYIVRWRIFEYGKFTAKDIGSDGGGFIKVPRGIMENIAEECEKACIAYEIEDKRCKGHSIHVEFMGDLKESQVPAVEKLL